MSTTEQRAELGFRATLAYGEGDDTEARIVDTLANIMHLCADGSGYDFDDCLERAKTQFTEEAER